MTGSSAPPPATRVQEPGPTQLEAAALPPGTAAQQAAAPATPGLQGVPLVVDSGTLVLNGTLVHLSGVDGEPGEPAQQLLRYIGGRPVECRPVDAENAQYRCTVGRYDVGEAVVLNGAARATRNAPPDLRTAEQQARDAGRGIWRR